MLPGGNAYGGSLATDARVPQDIVRAGRFFHPIGLKLAQQECALNRLLNSPFLVGIHHHVTIPSDFLAHELSTPQIVLRSASHLQFEASPPISKALTAKLPNLLITKPEPAS